MRSNYPINRGLRLTLLAGVAFVILTIVYSIVSVPTILTLDPQGAAFYLGVLAVILVGYTWYSLRSTRITPQTDTAALRRGVLYGIIVALLWMVEITTGNLNSSHRLWAMAIYRAATLAVPVVTVIASAVGARRTLQATTGVMIGLLSGIISGLVVFFGIMLLFYTLQSLLPIDPQDWQQFLRSGAADYRAFSFGDTLTGAINHLWIGPFLGAIFGAVGGAIGSGLRTKNR